MRVLCLHDVVPEGAAPDVLDVFVQLESISASLKTLGHEVVSHGVGLDLAAARDLLRQVEPDLVFNLIESVEGMGRLIHLPTSLFDALAIPYTGSPTEAIFLTTSKLLAKERLRSAGLPTPDWWALSPDGTELVAGPDSAPLGPSRRVIVKSIWEDASLGLDDSSIVRGPSAAELSRVLVERAPSLGGACFAEEFIDGREFNLSVLAGTAGPIALPPAEMEFASFPEGKPRIVGYRAKWDPTSFEYSHTQRRFDLPARDRELLDRLRSLSVDSWRVFGMGGYGRVDFRVDERGEPWILELNANPCLSPDAGFAAAAEREGVTYVDLIARIVDSALARSGRQPAVAARTTQP